MRFSQTDHAPQRVFWPIPILGDMGFTHSMDMVGYRWFCMILELDDVGSSWMILDLGFTQSETKIIQYPYHGYHGDWQNSLWNCFDFKAFFCHYPTWNGSFEVNETLKTTLPLGAERDPLGWQPLRPDCDNWKKCTSTFNMNTTWPYKKEKTQKLRTENINQYSNHLCKIIKPFHN